MADAGRDRGGPVSGFDRAVRPSEADITDALRTVIDPELGMSIVDLGLVHEIDLEGGHVRVTMTLTAPGCPIHDVMPEWVRTAIARVRGVEHVDVALTFDPPWTPARIAARP
jgi:metal-sulfur cluster biosynthetic enzyme